VRPESWDAIDEGCAGYLHAWQRCLERHLIGYRPEYILAERGPTLVGFGFRHTVPTGLTTLGWSGANGAAAGRHLDRLRAGGAAQVCRAIRLGNAPLASSLPGVVVRLDDLAPDEVRGRILDELDRPWALARVVTGSADPCDPVGALLRARGYAVVPSAGWANLDIEWSTFEDYLDAQPSKWRRQIRWTIRDAERRGLEVRELDRRQVGVYEERLEALFTRTCRAHGADSPFTPGILSTFADELGPSAAFLVAFARGEPVGFVFGASTPRVLGFALAGFDYTCAKELKAVSSLYYAIVRAAIDRRKSRAMLGLSNLDMKRRIGCRIEAGASFVRTPSRLATRALCHAIDLHDRLWSSTRCSPTQGSPTPWSSTQSPSAAPLPPTERGVS
jgi:hypothetical protein